ncbi:helix-turn-helix transcriptional regulator [Leucobacter coleopterorum]|uniref:Helix-turn-helix transcriptional regulator n=1 Tax=Leucobacter coleopterorum TaxID=2714933 RepID=A0ABX6JXJ6_9MICO|nr:helix-turn-helix transcriptional regulator [Leucobacter coleopterorum]QIM17549.1 helix-turn-helix transcriptional regulator [Leucobacter coleopterorum]
MKYTARLRAPADFGLAIQQARLDRGLSQTELAEEASLRQSTVSEIESGKATIYLRQMLELARASGCEIFASWGEEDADAPRS